jgi:hypothetical protein
VPCLFGLLALLAPRVVSVVLWLFTTFFERAFAGRTLLLLAGVVLLPFTTLAYAWRVNVEGGIESTLSIVVLVVAAIVDLSSLAGGRRRRGD